MKALVSCLALCASLCTSALGQAQSEDQLLFNCSKIGTSSQLTRAHSSSNLKLVVNAIQQGDFNFLKNGYTNAYRLLIDFNDPECHFTELDNAKVFVCRGDSEALQGIIVGDKKVAVRALFVSSEIVRRTYQVYDEGTYHDSNTLLNVAFIDAAGHHIEGTVNFGFQCDATK